MDYANSFIVGNEPVAPGGEAPPSACPPAVESVQRLAVEIMRRRQEHLGKKIKPKPRKSIWASQIPDCERQGVYEFLNWKDKKLHDWKLEALFEAGRNSEDNYKAQLRELKMELVEDGVSIGDDMVKKYGVHGYLDTRIKWEGKRVPVEMKMMSPMIFDKMRDGVEGIEAMKRFFWTRKYIRQGLVYLLGTNEEVLMFALTNGRGDWKFPILELDYEVAGEILNKVERINKAVEKKELPERVPFDNELCGRCAFQHICIPDINADPRVRFVDNHLMADILERRAWLEENAKEFAKLDKKLKGSGKQAGMLDGIENEVLTVGNFVITRTTKPTPKYEVPEEIKKQYETEGKRTTTKIERFDKPDADSIYLEPKRILSLEDSE